MLGALKDNIASLAAKSLLAGRLERYGQLLDLRIHSRERTMSLEMLLAGEEKEIRIEVGRYRMASEGGKLLLVIESLRASREWLQLALEDFLVGQPLQVPSIAAMALGKPEA
jgi:hypothetical protein